MSRPLKALVLAAMVSAVSAASAAEQVFQFVGEAVYSSLPDAVVGDVVIGTFRYDAGASPVNVFDDSSGARFASYAFSGPGFLFEASVGGYVITSSELRVRVTDNLGGNLEDIVYIGSGQGLSINNEVIQNGSISVVFASAPGNTDVFQGVALPLSYDMRVFDAMGSGSGNLQTGGGPEDLRLLFNVTSITAVPEPEAGVLALLGLATVGMASRRRSWRSGALQAQPHGKRT